MSHARYCLLALFFCHVLIWHMSLCCSKPLHLTPLLDKKNISGALALSEVNDPTSIIPKSYAGFITADRKLKNHLFFWFFPATSANSSKAPLVVWLNGGPGVSSMLGLTYENGPIRLKDLGDRKVTYEKWDKSWTEAFSMLYIDNPVGVGFSYSECGEDGWKTNQDGYAADLYNFLEQFYVMFPEYLKRELYIGGQSYAGKYVPAFAYRAHKEIVAKKSFIPLTGIYLAGPFFDPEVQFTALGDFFYAMGAISHAQLMKFKQNSAVAFENFKKEPRNRKNFEKLGATFSSGIDFNPQNNYVTMELPPYGQVTKLMNSLRRHIHVGDRIYNSNNYIDKFIEDRFVSTKSKMVELMNNYKVLIFNGDYDALISTVMIEEALLSAPWALQGQYNNSERLTWKSNGATPRGYFTHVGQFCRVVIFGAGHQVPYDQPDSSRDLMVQFVEHGCVKDRE